MQDATTSFYKLFEDFIDKNNNLYEQTEQRKEFIGNVKDIIENEIDKNKKYDYFSSFTKDTNKKKLSLIYQKRLPAMKAP